MIMPLVTLPDFCSRLGDASLDVEQCNFKQVAQIL